LIYFARLQNGRRLHLLNIRDLFGPTRKLELWIVQRRKGGAAPIDDFATNCREKAFFTGKI
jgi:hypothetical protein